MPAWRIEPPIICFQRHASSMSSVEPARQAPSGAPRPFVKSIHAVSNSDAQPLAETPLATTAFMSRAPSRCVRSPCSAATPRTASSRSSGHTRPPMRFVVCSTCTSRDTGW